MKVAELMREGFEAIGGGSDVDSFQPRKAKSAFWSSGHTPTLIAAFLYFDLAFMVWVLLGPLAPEIARDIGLSSAQKGPDGRDADAGRRDPAAARRPARRPDRP
jgi:NNP family nitrate/nitrite transporter-like MFS transporter